MNLFISLLWISGALVWCALGNPWLAALFSLNAGIWLAAFIEEIANG